MPPVALHMVLARQVALDLGLAALPSDSGQYILGATTPDIRVLTKQDRMSTHYFDLNVEEHQDSVAAFLRENGRFLESDISQETRQFAAGYVSHLVLDEQYITGIYRPFFARHEALGGRIRANVMDRLLQFDLERAYCSDDALSTQICGALACTIEGIECGFIEPDTLERWREVSADIASRSMDWERMRSMIANHLRFGGLEEGETLGGFLDALPELLDETISHVTNAELDAFIQRSKDAARVAVERYLA